MSNTSQLLHCVWKLALLLLSFLPLLQATEAANNNDFLYSILPFEESDPIIEFEPPPLDTNYNNNGEDVALRPDFLYSTEQETRRVVLYYLPWCPHCKAYVPTYIALARRVQEMITMVQEEQEQQGTTGKKTNSNVPMEVEFYAVSCLPNKQVCKDQHVGGVPGIKIYPAGSITGTPTDPLKLHPFQIMRILGIPWGGTRDDWEGEEEESTSEPDRGFLKGRRRQQLNSNRSGGHNNNQQHDMFEDAYRSFHFTMKTEIYMANGPLAEKPKKALADWLLLLQNALPLSWRRFQLLLQDLVDNFETISKQESDLLTILAKYPPKSQEWSYSCARGEDGNGYTCGLWHLLHILTVGVVQFNENGISANADQAIYKTADVAQIIRDFIENFFACNVCRKEFLQAFDSCSHDRCHRLLVDTVGEQPDWRELPVWLWEEHNSVNLRLMRERQEQQSTTNKLQSTSSARDVQWPSRKDCPKCWGGANDDASFDKDIVYAYLLKEYWPGFSHSEGKGRHLLGSALASFGGSSDESILAIPFALFGLPLIGPMVLLIMWCRKRLQKKQSGRHKKLDL